MAIPTEIKHSEEIVRVLLNPIHIKNNRELKPYAFQPPKGSEDISVNRLSYSSLNDCKNQGLKMQKEKNLFWGLGIVRAKVINDCGFGLEYTPTESNIAHADIKIGETKIENEPLSIDTTIKIKQLISKLTVFTDPFPDQSYWEAT